MVEAFLPRSLPIGGLLPAAAWLFTIKLTQTASQYRAGPTVGVSFLYDADKDKTSETPPGAGPFLTSYDGDDRVIQVVKGWYTQNLYDLSQGGTLPVAGGPSVQAYGNLYETLVHNATGDAECGASGGVVKSPYFIEQRAMAYDAADRVTATYRWNCPPVAKTSTYDTNGNLGLLSSITNEVGQTTSYTYDTNGRQLGITFGAPSGLPVTPSRNYSYDADDHQTQITSGILGTEKRSYDVDGNLVQYVEAGGDGLTGPVTIQYQPYFDDKRESMTATSSSLSSPLIYTYHYQTDGLRQSLTTSGAPDGNRSFSWTYTPAGRKLQQIDNTFGVTDISSYDVDGRTNSLTFSAGSLTSFSYDQRDNVTGYVSPATPSPNTISYDGLDEITAFTSAVACGPFFYRKYQDGVLYSNQNSKTTPCEGESAPLNPATLNAFDSRNGQVTGSSFSGTPGIGAYAFTDGLLFDAAGRENSGTSVITLRLPQAHGGYTTTTESGTFSASYDNEDHVQSRNFSTFANGSLFATSANTSLVWGLDGHPEQINSMMLHWDGDQPLFYSVAGASTCTYVEQLSQCGYSLDRDQSGALVEIHNAQGNSGVCPSTLFPSVSQYSYQVCFNPTSGFGTPDLSPAYVTGDGLEINAPVLGATTSGGAALIIQGTRAFNPATSQWTTPDAYAGEVDDPQSQRSYIWKNNNPIEYEDPSGFDAIYLIARNPGAPNTAHLFIEVRDDHGKITHLYSFGPDKSGFPFSGSKLVEKDQTYDSGKNGLAPIAFAGTLIGSCTGTCTPKNGGVDEKMLPLLATEINNLGLTYEFYGPNSNSAAYTLCQGIGGSNCASPNTGGRFAPGYGQDVLDSIERDIRSGPNGQ